MRESLNSQQAVIIVYFCNLTRFLKVKTPFADNALEQVKAFKDEFEININNKCSSRINGLM